MPRPCSKKGCVRPHVAKGLCHAHYERKRLGLEASGPIKSLGKAKGQTCTLEGCQREVTAKGKCLRHYYQGRYRGVWGLCLYCERRAPSKARLCGEHKNLPDRCLLCRFKRTIDAAHILPRRLGHPKAAWNMMPLCPNHHRLYDRGALSLAELRKLRPLIHRAERMAGLR